jgi:ABC-2 type transport system permease protein
VRGSVVVRIVQLIGGSLGLAALLVTLVMAAYRHNVRYDLSPGSRFTLSDHALAVLRSLSQPAHVTGFIRTEDPRNVLLKDLLWQAKRESPNLTYDIVDVNRNPAMAAEYKVSTYGSAVVESGGRRRDFTGPTEGQLIAALLAVTQPPKKVYALTGHGECSISDSERHRGCSALHIAIRGEHFDVAELSLFGARSVPDDADILLIAGPTADPLQSEIDAIAAYLDRGGKLLALIDPFVAPRLGDLLTRYGIVLGSDVVLDPENRLGGGEMLSAVITDLSRQHQITATLDSPALFSGIRSVEGRADDAVDRSVVRLLRSGPRSWATEDPEVLRGAQPRFVAGRDRNGPITVGVEVNQPAKTPLENGEARRRTVLIVYGDSQFVSNRFLEYLGNRDLVLNSLNWLARDDMLVSARAKSKTPGKNFFFVSQAEMATLFRAAVMIQPGCFLVLGILVLLRRRMRL